ncbi:hypothetical protein GX50_01668 [[Emmonsia] crescens]|uniref:Uncharacterized protein n=1 Tax=[Emmonsia] crescens TaxID=73230 RepID=A0A2B7ZQI6_9EURO|nr:hypothetical protein GX50_01668 [Emmonsia crescens]
MSPHPESAGQPNPERFGCLDSAGGEKSRVVLISHIVDDAEYLIQKAIDRGLQYNLDGATVDVDGNGLLVPM